MKKTIIFCIYFLVVQNCFSQTSFEAKVSKVLGYIERNLESGEREKDAAKADFFVYQVSIDRKGRIKEVHTLFMDSTRNNTQAIQIADSIRAKFHFTSSKYNTLFIPVMIVYSDDDDTISRNDNIILGTAGFFDTLSKLKIKGTFIARLATIAKFSVINKKKRNE